MKTITITATVTNYEAKLIEGAALTTINITDKKGGWEGHAIVKTTFPLERLIPFRKPTIKVEDI